MYKLHRTWEGIVKEKKGQMNDSEPDYSQRDFNAGCIEKSIWKHLG